MPNLARQPGAVPGRTELSLSARDGVPLACLIIVIAATVMAGFRPAARNAWFAESLPVFIAVPVLTATYRRFRFSARTYVQVTLLILLHLIGSHYTYADVPLGEWAQKTFGFSRNAYDRVVHFSFGLLLFWPVRELLFRREHRRHLRAELLFTFALLSSIGLIYEFIEWVSSMVVVEQTREDYLGLQGDVWDAHKDMACNGSGALLALISEWLRERHNPRWAGMHAEPVDPSRRARERGT